MANCSTSMKSRVSSQLVPDYVIGITARSGADRRRDRDRARGADRASSCGQDRDHQLEQGRLFRRLFLGRDHRRVDGRDDNTRVGGLQGGTATARAFAADLRYAVKDRPVEEFDTDLQLPEWQLEPDDEYMFGDPEDYYFIDEQGNLIEPGTDFGHAAQRPPSRRTSTALRPRAAEPVEHL